MSQKQFLLGIDQGTSGSRALVLDEGGQVRGYGYRALARLHPQSDWVYVGIRQRIITDIDTDASTHF